MSKTSGLKLGNLLIGAITLALSVILITGCSSTGRPTIQQLSKLPEKGVCRVAVLPFANESEYPLGGLIFYRIFMAEMIASGHFDVAQEGDIMEIYQQIRLLPGQLPQIEQVKILGNRLGVDVVIEGTVVQMEERRLMSGMNPSVTVMIRILDAGTGKTIWGTYHRRRGEDFRTVMHFGMVNTITDLATKMSKEIIQSWKQKGLNGCES